MNTLIRFSIFAAMVLGMASCSVGRKKTWTYEPSANGKTAIIVKGKAVPPANIPHAVLRAVSAGNRICGKPYLMGGGTADLRTKRMTAPVQFPISCIMPVVYQPPRLHPR